MDSSDYEIVADVLCELKQEYHAIQKKMDEYQAKVREADCYIQSFLEKEDSQYKMFSPRDPQDLYRDEIAGAASDKNVWQQELNLLYHERNTLRSRIDRLEKVGKKEHESPILTPRMREQDFEILNIQEADRQRIARDLHDTSLQNLTYLIHKIELCSMYIDQDPVKAKLELSTVSKTLHSTIDDIRNTIFDLRPMTFNDLGLRSAFENLVQVINEENKYEMDMEIEDAACENDLLLATIYRVVQECLNNIVKHAGAGKILFHCKNREDTYVIDIEDDGKGFTGKELEEKKDKHFGMTVMRERVNLLGGKLSVDSAEGEGTKIHIEIPLVSCETEYGGQ